MPPPVLLLHGEPSWCYLHRHMVPTRYKAGVRQFPLPVPITDAHASVAECRQAWEVLSRFDKPFLTAFSDRDPITRGGARVFRERIPGAKGQPHTTIRGAGHFLQEDKPAELVELIDR